MQNNNGGWVNQTGCNCCSSGFLCSCVGTELAKSIGNIGTAFVNAKAGKKPASQNQPPSSGGGGNNNNPPPPSKFTAKNIAIYSVVGIVVIAAIAGGIWAAKHSGK